MTDDHPVVAPEELLEVLPQHYREVAPFRAMFRWHCGCQFSMSPHCVRVDFWCDEHRPHPPEAA